jgi:hypothetical protein
MTMHERHSPNIPFSDSEADNDTAKAGCSACRLCCWWFATAVDPAVIRAVGDNRHLALAQRT